MARMIPVDPDSDTPRSEREVFAVLEEGLPEDWIVIHSRRFFLPASANRKREEGEVDFLVLDPRRGFIALEVKGGDVGRDQDGWFTIPSGATREQIKDPGRQAQHGAHAINRYLAEYVWFRRNRVKAQFGFGVVFPASKVGRTLDPALPRELIIDQGDLEDINESVGRVFNANRLDDRVLPEGFADAFIDALAPSFNLAQSLWIRIERDERELVRLTDEQVGILDLLQENKRVAVKGGPGTGKTLLAVEKARRLARDGKRVLFLCFQKLLAQHVKSCAEGFAVKHFHSCCFGMARRAGIQWEFPDRYDDQQKFWGETAPELLLASLEKLPGERFDAVIVDEGQDFKELWWPAVDSLLREPRTGTLYVFHDLGQDVFGRSHVDSLGLVPARLGFNCRNTRRIAEFVATAGDRPAVLKPGAPEGVEVTELTGATHRACVEHVRKLLHRYVVTENIPTDRIVILTLKPFEYSKVWEAGHLGNIEIVEWTPSTQPNQIRMASAIPFRGLEADVVILCDDDRRAGHELWASAASRARHVLAVVTYS